MVLIGILITLAGFLLSLMSLGMVSSVGGRMVMVLVGMVVSIAGIGMLNKAYLKDAIWKK
jgi:hypothetical protein